MSAGSLFYHWPFRGIKRTNLASLPQGQKVSPPTGWKQMDSQLMGRAEAAEVELVKSIFHFVSTNMLCGDWGQSDRQDWPPPSFLHPSVLTHTHAHTTISTVRPGFVFCVQVSWGKRLWLGLTHGKNTSPHLPTGTQSLQEQWEVTKVILQLQHSPDGPRGIVICRQKTCMCRTQLGVLPRV